MEEMKKQAEGLQSKVDEIKEMREELASLRKELERLKKKHKHSGDRISAFVKAFMKE